ncbi:MAG: (2Fe-2S)-binding protein [Siculibacillus sp.]|nr:(2Fe-2S)-binding protein [Siculibacillus sp.]
MSTSSKDGRGTVIVCSCNVISDHVVRRAIDDPDAPVARVSCLFGYLGCRPQCGRCAPTLRRLIRESGAADRTSCPAAIDDIGIDDDAAPARFAVAAE